MKDVSARAEFQPGQRLPGWNFPVIATKFHPGLRRPPLWLHAMIQAAEIFDNHVCFDKGLIKTQWRKNVLNG